MLTFCSTLALFAAFEAVRGGRLRWSWWLLSAAACGLGVLGKGPVAVALLVPPLILHRWLTGRPLPARAGPSPPSSPSSPRCRCRGTPPSACGSRSSPGSSCGNITSCRFLTPFAHERGVWFYGPVLLLGLLPATLLLVPFLRFLSASDETTARRRPAEFGFLLLAGGWCVLFFTLSSCKLPTYILPAFPPLALALGWFLTQSRWDKSRWPATAAVGAFLLLAGFHHVVVPWYAACRSPMNRPDEVPPPLRRPGHARRLLPARLRLRGLLPRPRRRALVPQLQGRVGGACRTLVRQNRRTVILCTHRSSLECLRELLPPEVRIVEAVHVGLDDLPGVPASLKKGAAALMGETALGLSDLAVVECPNPIAHAAAAPPAPKSALADLTDNEP